MITIGTYLLSPKDRTSPGGPAEKVTSDKGCLLTLVVEAKLALGYPEELVRTHKEYKNTSITSVPADMSYH